MLDTSTFLEQILLGLFFWYMSGLDVVVFYLGIYITCKLGIYMVVEDNFHKIFIFGFVTYTELQ